MCCTWKTWQANADCRLTCHSVSILLIDIQCEGRVQCYNMLVEFSVAWQDCDLLPGCGKLHVFNVRVSWRGVSYRWSLGALTSPGAPSLSTHSSASSCMFRDLQRRGHCAVLTKRSLTLPLNSEWFLRLERSPSGTATLPWCTVWRQELVRCFHCCYYMVHYSSFCFAPYVNCCHITWLIYLLLCYCKLIINWRLLLPYWNNNEPYFSRRNSIG